MNRADPFVSEKFMKRAAGLQRVTSMLASAYSQEKAADIVLKEGLKVLGAENGEIVMLATDGNLYALAHTGYPKKFVQEYGSQPKDTPLLTTDVIKTQKPLFIKDISLISSEYEAAKTFLTASGAKSAAFLPLLIRRKLTGVILFTFPKVQEFDRVDKLFMITLANQFAIAFERVSALESLRSSREQLEVILKNTADGVVVENLEGKYVFINKTASSLLGIAGKKREKKEAFADILERFELTDERGKPRTSIHRKDKAFFREGKRVKSTIRLTDKITGEVRWLTVTSMPIVDLKKTDTLIISTLHDVTQVKELDQRKDDFISMTSHELKTPLTSMKLFLDVLDRTLQKERNQKIRTLVTKVKEQADRLQRHVSDLMDISRIQKGKLDLHRTRFRLDFLIQESINELQFKGAQRILFRQSSPVALYGDMFRIRQVITNLVNNALKYSPETSKVIVSLKKSRKEAVVSVTDRGIGIAKSDQEKIFDRFFQATNRKEKSASGLGMGLYIANEIVKSHKGTMSVSSKPGKGATFTFTLPLR